MPIATPAQYAEIPDTAKPKRFAFTAFNASSSQPLNAALHGLAESGSDGISQASTGGADYFAGHTVKARATGALAFARFAHEVAKNYPITVALHTDHCPKPALADFVFPLIEASEAEVKAGRNPIFQSHMWDGSAVPLDENLDMAKEILPRMRRSTPSSRSRSASSAAKRTACSTRVRTRRSTRRSTTRSRPS